MAELDRDGDGAQRILAGTRRSKPAKTFHFYPKVYKAAVAAANGSAAYADYSEKVRELELDQPVSLRHILDLRRTASRSTGRGRTRGGPATPTRS